MSGKSWNAFAVTLPGQRGKGRKAQTSEETQDQTPAERRASKTWAQGVKQVFNIDIDTCSECAGVIEVIASIEDRWCSKRFLSTWIRMSLHGKPPAYAKIVLHGKLAGLRKP